MSGQMEKIPDLATLLDRHREEIATTWAELVHRLPDSRYRERPLAELCASTRRGLEAIIEALTTGSHAALEDYLTDVSLIRLQMGFNIAEVTGALLLCKDAALPLIWRTYPPGTAATQEAISRLDACLRWIVSHFAGLYAAEASRHLREEQERTALMLETAQAASGSLELDEVLHRVARGLASAVGVRHCGIYLVDEEKGLLIPTEGADPASLGPGVAETFLKRPTWPSTPEPAGRRCTCVTSPLIPPLVGGRGTVYPRRRARLRPAEHPPR